MRTNIHLAAHVGPLLEFSSDTETGEDVEGTWDPSRQEIVVTHGDEDEQRYKLVPVAG